MALSRAVRVRVWHRMRDDSTWVHLLMWGKSSMGLKTLAMQAICVGGEPCALVTEVDGVNWNGNGDDRACYPG